MNALSLLNSQILDALSEHVAVIDKDGVVIYTNKAWDNFVQKNDNSSRVEIGVNYLDVLKKSQNSEGDKLDFCNGILNVIKRDENYFQIDYPFNSSNIKRWYTMHVSPIGDNGAVVIANSDITERVLMEIQVRKNESRISKLFDSASEGIFTANNKGIITLVNDATCTMFGYSREELVGASIEKLMLPKDKSHHHTKVDYFFSNSHSRKMGNGKIEIKGSRKNGETFPIGVSLSSFELENEKLAVAFVSDLTEINDAKTEIQQQADLLLKTSEMAQIGTWKWNIKDDNVMWDKVLHQIFETKKGFEPSFEGYIKRVEEGEIETVKNSIYKALEEKSYFENNYKITTYKGNIKHLKTWGKVELDEDGNAINMLGVCKDVTSQVEKENELKESELRFRELFEKLNAIISGTNTGVWEWDLVTNEVHFSKEWGQQLGYSYDEIVQEFATWEKLVHPDDIDETKKRIETYLKGEQKEYNYIHRLKHKNGEWKHILTKAVVSKRAEDGSPLYLMGTHNDVNKEVLYLQEISEYEKHFSVSMDLVCIVNVEGYFIKVNSRFVELLGYTELDLMSQPMIDFVHPDDVDKTRNEVEKVINGKQTTQFVNRYKCKNGDYKHLMWTSKLDPDSGLRYSGAHDVTALVGAQEKSKQYFDILNNSLNEMYIICAKTLHFIDANIGAQKNIGYTVKELQELTPIDLKPDITEEYLQRIVEPLVIGKEPFVTFETRHQRKDGSTYMAFLNLQLTKLGGKDVFIALALDVTERVVREAELKSTKKRLENIVDYANVGITYTNKENEVVKANNKFAKILEYDSGEEIVGMGVKDFTHPDDLDADLYLSQEIKDGKRDAYQIEKRYVTKNKNIKWVDLNVSAIRNKSGELENFIAMAIDITAKKEIQENLIRNEKNYRGIVDSFHDVITRVNSKGILEMVSPSVENILGYKVTDVLNNKATDLYVNASDRDAYLQEVKEKGFVNNYQTQVYNKKGDVVDIVANGRLYEDSYGDYGVQTVFMDVTETKKNALKIARSEKRLKDVFDNVNDAILVTNMNSEIQEYNNAFISLCEVEIDYNESVSKYITMLHSEKKDRIGYLKKLEKDGVNSFEGEMIIGNGKIKWIDTKSTAIYDEEQKLIGIRDVVRDVTERKEKEEVFSVLTELSSTHGGKHYFKKLSNSLSELLNVEHVIIGLYHRKEERVESLGYSLSGELQDNFSYQLLDTPCKIVLEGEFELVESGVQKKYPKDKHLAEMNAESYMGVTLFKGEDPIGIIALLDSKPFTNIDFITSILIQIKTRIETEITRTKVEGLIIKREARFRGMIENSSEITCLIDETGTVKYIAPSITKILNYTVEELLGEKIFDYIHEDDREKTVDRLMQEYEDGSDGVYDVYRLKKKEGGFKYFRAILSNHFNTEGINGFIINAQDISELIIAENERYKIALHTEEKERKRFSQDLHDGLGQTIAAASLYMNTLDDLVGDQLDAETLEIFKTGKDLVNKSAKETRMVSHNIMPPSLTQFGLSDSLSEMVSNYQKIKDNVDITFKSNIREHRFTHEVELSLYRVVQELINNALKHSKAKHIDVSVLIHGLSCEISVKDDGIGFDYDVIKKDKKSGIGLKNIEQRIKVVEGDLEINSRDEGTEFVITIAV